MPRKRQKCGIKGCTFTNDWPPAMGRHKRDKHGIAGTGATSIRYRLKRQMTVPSGPYTCPQCGDSFSFPQVLGTHLRKKHGVMGKSLSARYRNSVLKQDVPENGNGHSTEAINNEEKNEIFALGHVTGWLDHYAASIGVSGPAFAARVAALLYRSTHR